MLVVIHVCQKDAEAAVRNLAWAQSLDGKVNHDCLLSHEIGSAFPQVMAAAQQYFRTVTDFAYPVLSRRLKPWPAFANWAWRQAALHIRRRPQFGHWLWWEQDAVPLRAGWLDSLDMAYRCANKPFMGAPGAIPHPSYPQHLNGVAIYPNDVSRWAPQSMFFGLQAFDVAGGWRVFQQAHITKLMQHLWTFAENNQGGPCHFENAQDFKRVSMDAVLFHRCKDSSLIEQIEAGALAHQEGIMRRRLMPKRRMRRKGDPPLKKKGLLTRFVESMVSTPTPTSDVTVVITNFQRADMLWAAYESTRRAKVEHVVISSSGATPAVELVHNRIKETNPNVVISSRREDLGCNEGWLRGVRLARTSRVTILHDDDILLPAYESIVAGKITSDIIHWDGDKHGPSGKFPGTYITRPDLPQGEHPATFLFAHLLAPAAYTLSPVCGCFPTKHVIETLEECEKNFGEWAYLRPTMMVGNDLLLWLRACQKFKTVYYSHTPFCSYGHWDGSASYDDCVNSRMKLLPIYKATRHWFFQHCPKMIHAVPRYNPTDKSTEQRIRNAMETWGIAYQRGFVTSNHQWHWLRDSTAIHEPKQTPFLKDVLEAALRKCGKDDTVVLTNDDALTNVFFWLSAWDWLKTHGAGCSFRCNIQSYAGYDAMKYPVTPIGECGPGRDAFFFTQDWLASHLNEIPDYVMGFGDWDSTLAMLIRLTAGNKPTQPEMVKEHVTSEIPTRFISHVAHAADWIKSFEQAGNKHNRALTVEFFKHRLGFEMPKFRGHW